MNERTRRIRSQAASIVQRGWTRSARAKDRHGKAVSWWDVRAARFSLVGALHRAGDEDQEALAVVLAELTAALGHLDHWNSAPSTTKVDVIQVLLR